MARPSWIIIVTLLAVALSCRSNPFGNTKKSIEEFNIYTSDFSAQNDGGAKDALLDVIGGAKVSLNCAFSALTLSEVTNALVNRARAGVQVKVAFDADVKDNDAGSLTLQSSGSFIVVSAPLDTNQSQLLYGNGGSAYMRHNYCLADERYIYISTAPPDDTLMRKTPNIALKIGSPQFGLARDFLRESNMFSQLLFGNGKAKTDFTTKFTALDQVIGAYWGPQEKPLDVLGTELSEAISRVDFYSTAFLTTNSSKTDLDVPQTLLRLESAKGIPLKKYFSSQALFDTSSKAYTLSNPAQYINSNVRVGANFFVIDRGLSSAKTFIYTGALRSQANSSDDSVLIELRGKYVAEIVGAYLDRIGAVSVLVSNTGDTSTNGAVAISELHWMGSYSNALVGILDDEFVEFYNMTGTYINMSGWKFACTTNGTTANSSITLPAGAVIGPGGYFVVANKSSNAFPNANHFDSGVDITNTSYQCRLGNGKTAAAMYGIANFGDVIDTAGNGSDTFQSPAWNRGLNDTAGKIRRSMERVNTGVGTGTNATDWQTNVFVSSQNISIDPAYKEQTLASPGASYSQYLPSVIFNRPVYFGTSTSHPNGVGKITVVSPSANANVGVAETVSVTVFSSSDGSGINLTLTETGVNTGTFSTTTHLNFTTAASTGNQIQVASGNLLTVRYAFASVNYEGYSRWYAQAPVINEVGANCGGDTKNDYVEIYNPNSVALNLSGIYLRRDDGCTLPAWSTERALSGSISGQSHFLITASDYVSGGSCPSSDSATTALTINDDDCLSLTAGNASVSIATDDAVIDFLGYGSSPVREGTAATDIDGGAANQCLSRITDGYDTGDNSLDLLSQGSMSCSPKSANPTPVFNVTSASALTNTTTLSVLFNRAPNAVQAQTVGNYCISLAAEPDCSGPDLTISTASLSGNTVTLTSSVQIGGTSYRVYVSGVTGNLGGTALTTSTATFSGYQAIFFNPSFESDNNSCSVSTRDGSNNVTAVTGTCPAGWTISISSASGVAFSSVAGTTPTGGGNNYATLASFTATYGDREIRMVSCLPVNKANPLDISGWYQKSSTNDTRIRHVVYFYTDSACSTLATGGTNPRVFTGQIITAQSVWENKTDQVTTGMYPTEPTLYYHLAIQGQRTSSGLIQYDLLSTSN